MVRAERCVCVWLCTVGARRPEACAEIIADARREAKASGGWRPRAIGCCTNDVLVSSLSNPVQQRIRDALEQVMPVVIEHFPEANLKPRSLPTKSPTPSSSSSTLLARAAPPLDYTWTTLR